MKKILIAILAVVVLFVVMPKQVEAWGPNTHANFTLSVLYEEEEPNLIRELVLDNEDAFMCGLMYPDVAVIYYYSNFKTYKAFHDWATQKELWENAENDRQRAFAIGYAVHLAQDMVSHNHYIPEKIRASKLPNVIIHPIYELSTDTNYITVRSAKSMEIHNEFDDWVASVVGMDMTEEAELLNQALGGHNFYEQSYTLPEHGWLYKTYNVASKIVRPFVKEKTYHPYMVRTMAETRKIFESNYPDTDPSGEESLKRADQTTKMWQWGIAFLVIAFVYWFSHRKGWI